MFDGYFRYIINDSQISNISHVEVIWLLIRNLYNIR